MNKPTRHSLESSAHELDQGELHEEILSQGRRRFPEESYQQLLQAGASADEALKMLGYSPTRQPLEDNDRAE